MKNTMKKLLSLVLVAMLLISIVPVFAAAEEYSPLEIAEESASNEPVANNGMDDVAPLSDDPSDLDNDNDDVPPVGDPDPEDPPVDEDLPPEDEGGEDEGGEDEGGDDEGGATSDAAVSANYRIYVDGTLKAYNTVSWKGSKTLTEVLQIIGTKYVANYNIKQIKVDGTVMGEEDEATPGADIWFYLTSQTGEIGLFLSSDSDDIRTVQVALNKSVKLTEALVRSKNFSIPEGKYVKHFINVDTNDLIPVNSYFKVTEEYTEFEVVLAEGKAPSTAGGSGSSGSGSSDSGSGSGSSGSGSGSSNGTSDKLNSNKVYLHVFLNNKIDAPVKNINITDGIAKDGTVSLNGDIKDVIKKYFTAKTSDGIGYDGIYFATGDFAGNFVTDSNKVSRITNIDELKRSGYVHLNVMITNAKLKTTSTADSSNPKTGDTIFVPVAVMGMSVAALAAAYYVSKKRFAR